MIINHLLYYLLTLHNLGGKDIVPIKDVHVDLNQFAKNLEKQKLLRNLVDVNVSMNVKIALIETYMGDTNRISATNVSKGQLLSSTDF